MWVGFFFGGLIYVIDLVFVNCLVSLVIFFSVVISVVIFGKYFDCCFLLNRGVILIFCVDSCVLGIVV